MREQKVIITESDKDINDWLDRGWKVVSVTAQHVSTSNGGNTYTNTELYGRFCFVLEKTSTNA